MTVSNERVVECPHCFGAHRVITVEGPYGRLTVIPCEDMSAKVGWLAFHDMPPRPEVDVDGEARRLVAEHSDYRARWELSVEECAEELGEWARADLSIRQVADFGRRAYEAGRLHGGTPELRLLRQLALSQQLANEGNPVAKQAAVEALEEWGRRFPQDGGEE